MKNLWKLLIAVLVFQFSVGASPAQAIGPASYTQNTQVSLNGLPKFGGTLTSRVIGAPAGAISTFKWVSGSKTLGTASSLTITDSKLTGKTVKLSVVTKAAGFADFKYTSFAINIGKFTVLDKGSNLGSLTPGTLVGVSSATVFPPALDVDGNAQSVGAVRWFAGGVDVSTGLNPNQHTITTDEIGKVITVRETVTNASLPTIVISRTLGTAQGRMTLVNPLETNDAYLVGETITITSAPTWSVQPTKVEYTWKRDNKVIKGATKSSYKLTSADLHKRVNLVVTAHKANYFDSHATAGGDYIRKPVTRVVTVTGDWTGQNGCETSVGETITCLTSQQNSNWFDINSTGGTNYITLNLPTYNASHFVRWSAVITGTTTTTLSGLEAYGVGSQYHYNNGPGATFNSGTTTWTTPVSNRGGSGLIRYGIQFQGGGTVTIKSAKVTLVYDE